MSYCNDIFYTYVGLHNVRLRIYWVMTVIY